MVKDGWLIKEVTKPSGPSKEYVESIKEELKALKPGQTLKKDGWIIKEKV